MPGITKKIVSWGKERGLSLDPKRRDPRERGMKGLVARVGKSVGEEEELIARVGKGRRRRGGTWTGIS